MSTLSTSIIPLGRCPRIANKILDPIMILLNGTFVDTPQQTHAWNIAAIDPKILDQNMVAKENGRPTRVPRWCFGVPIFHIPILGGWREYVVVKPTGNESPWHCGWSLGTIHGCSRIPLQGPVRLLIADMPTSYFGLNSDGKQIPIEVVGYGKIGIKGPYSRLPLL